MKVTNRIVSLGLSLSLAASLGLIACTPDRGPAGSSVTTPSTNTNERPSGTKPVLDSEGMPVNCEIMVDGLCYMATDAACAAANCPAEQCLVLESYPGQISCDTNEPSGEQELPVSNSDSESSSGQE